jgi:hypothetical protein
MKPRVLSAMFTHHVDGQVGCAVGANRHWVDVSTPDRGSATYNESTGQLTLIRNDLQPPPSFDIGGKVELNSAVTLLPNCDIRVRYHVVSQPPPGNNRYSRWYLRMFDGGGNNDARIGILNGGLGGSGYHRIQFYRGSLGWTNGPEAALIDGQFRITKLGSYLAMTYWTGTEWGVGSNITTVSTTPWRLELVAGSWDAEYPTTPPRAGATIEVQLSEFGAY